MTNINPAIYAMGAIFAGPSADGTNGQVLVTNGSKQLSFTTIVSGVTALNSLTGSLSIAVGTSGSDVAVSASGSTVTVNIPDAGASARGVITTGTQTIAGAKTFSTNVVVSNASNAVVPLAINLASGQTADVIQVTANGGLAGDTFRIDQKGNVTLKSNSDGTTGVLKLQGTGASCELTQYFSSTYITSTAYPFVFGTSNSGQVQISPYGVTVSTAGMSGYGGLWFGTGSVGTYGDVGVTRVDASTAKIADRATLAYRDLIVRNITLQADASHSVSIFVINEVSSTSTNRENFSIDTAWIDSTDATRKARATFNAYDTAIREFARGWADGSTGRFAIATPASAPTDAHLAAGQISFYLDETGHNLIVRAKYADGTTLKTATIPLV